MIFDLLGIWRGVRLNFGKLERSEVGFRNSEGGFYEEEENDVQGRLGFAFVPVHCGWFL